MSDLDARLRWLAATDRPGLVALLARTVDPDVLRLALSATQDERVPRSHSEDTR